MRPAATTRFLLSGLAAAVIAAAAAASEFRIAGGALKVDATLRADSVAVDSAAVFTGSGTVDAAQTDVAGTLAPGTSGVQGSLAFTGDLVFQPGSAYDCDVAATDSVDRLVVAGTATGPGTVRVANPSGAIPVGQIIIDGGSGSAYGDCAVADPGATNWGLAENPATDLALTRLDGDTDANGLPDWWELAYFGQRTGTDPDGHDDTDGIPNGDEYAMQTDPADGDSYLRITQITAVSGNAVLIWPSAESPWFNVPDPTYTVQATTNLAAAAFTNLATSLPANPPENTYTNVAPDSNACYRVVQP